MDGPSKKKLVWDVAAPRNGSIKRALLGVSLDVVELGSRWSAMLLAAIHAEQRHAYAGSLILQLHDGRSPMLSVCRLLLWLL
jgi:hypothetical protein